MSMGKLVLATNWTSSPPGGVMWCPPPGTPSSSDQVAPASWIVWGRARSHRGLGANQVAP